MNTKPGQRWFSHSRGIVVEIVKTHSMLWGEPCIDTKIVQAIKAGFAVGEARQYYEYRFSNGEFQYLEGQDSPQA